MNKEVVKQFTEISTVSSLSEFIYTFENELNELYKDEKLRIYFRGEKQYFEQRCTPSLFRLDKNDINKKNEKDIYYHTLRRMPNEFNNLSNLDILAKMQHYGIRTRMLDITTNPLIALFFALDDNSEDGYVYIFKADSSNQILSYDSDRALMLSTLPKFTKEEQGIISSLCDKYPDTEIKSKHIGDRKNSELDIDSITRKTLSKFIYECERERSAFINHRILPSDLTKYYYVKPQFANERLQAQDGLFILFGLNQHSVKEEIAYIKINAIAKKKILAELMFFTGVSNSKIFKGLESLAKENKTRLFQDLKEDKNEISELEQQAFTGVDYAYKYKVNSNKELATMGDAILSLCITEYFFEMEIAKTKEELTDWKSMIQDNSVLNMLGEKIISTKNCLFDNNDFNNEKKYADIVEALLYVKYCQNGIHSPKQMFKSELIPLLKDRKIQKNIINKSLSMANKYEVMFEKLNSAINPKEESK
ncbi:FRG domain-containing protein [Acholeplasma equirhinis]|uniref:FRG domain-containing protein n=1 Tax=Acholeplasma equirhinis TaxID=555393 RepID=UPI00197AE8B9|nr:FRG domain-containing protein [Acholeplasma equirhinis]MBN3490596.1 FRG domain-containing protein [Acholeplasma equirhinis]